MSNDWLTSEQVLEQFNLAFSTVDRWRRRGCPVLGGRRLRAKRVKGVKGYKRLFSAEDIRRVVETPPWDGLHRDSSGQEWLSTRLAGERFGFSPDRLDAWRMKGCSALGGHKLRAQLIRVREAAGIKFWCRNRWAYHLQDLETIASGLRRENEWLTHEEVRENYGWSVMTLWQWRKDGCPHLAGRRPRAKTSRVARVRHRARGSHEAYLRALLYYRADLDEIARNYKASPEDTAEAGWLSYREVKARYGIGPSTLNSWSTKGCRHLGGRRIGTKRVLAGVGNRMIMVTKYVVADLERIADILQPGQTVRLREQAHVSNGQAELAEAEPDSGASPVTPGGVRLVLGEFGARPIVLGVEKDPVTLATHDVLSALLEAGNAGLTKDELDRASGHTEARKYVKRLVQMDPDGWGQIIQLPGRSWGRYRINA